jgi:D-threo-aldose 1-dehydrogenase
MDPYERTVLPRSGLEMPRLGLGTAALGGLYAAVSHEDAVATVDTSYELGLRLFDTAPLYGYGLAEERLGAALRTRRRDFVLSTKVGRLLRPDAPPDPTQLSNGEPIYRATPALNPVVDFTATGVRTSLQESRERIGIDQIDLVYVHDPESSVAEAIGSAYPTLAAMRNAGEIRAVGVGSLDTDVLIHCARHARFDCFLLAGRYTLLDFSAAAELLPLCRDRGIAVIAGAVFNSGILAQPTPGARFDYHPARPEMLRRAAALDEVCRKFEVPLMAAAMQFTAAHPSVVSIVVGARSVSEIRQNVELFARHIPGGLWAELKQRQLIPVDAPVPQEV